MVFDFDASNRSQGSQPTGDNSSSQESNIAIGWAASQTSKRIRAAAVMNTEQQGTPGHQPEYLCASITGFVPRKMNHPDRHRPSLQRHHHLRPKSQPLTWKKPSRPSHAIPAYRSQIIMHASGCRPRSGPSSSVRLPRPVRTTIWSEPCPTPLRESQTRLRRWRMRAART